jgi:hypothetical protein
MPTPWLRGINLSPHNHSHFKPIPLTPRKDFIIFWDFELPYLRHGGDKKPLAGIPETAIIMR